MATTIDNLQPAILGAVLGPKKAEVELPASDVTVDLLVARRNARWRKRWEEVQPEEDAEPVLGEDASPAERMAQTMRRMRRNLYASAEGWRLKGEDTAHTSLTRAMIEEIDDSDVVALHQAALAVFFPNRALSAEPPESQDSPEPPTSPSDGSTPTESSESGTESSTSSPSPATSPRRRGKSTRAQSGTPGA